MKKKFISIILPSYNSKKYIIKTINSILNQTYKNFELLIIDDCSTDGTYEYLKKVVTKYKKENVRIKLFKTKKNSGTVAHPRNFGVKKCKGELICFLDADDNWEADKLEKQLRDFKKDKYIYITSAKYFSFKGYKSNFMINYIRKKMQSFIINKTNKDGYFWLYIYNPVIVSSVLIHNKIIKNNLFDENKFSREDYDLWIRLRKKNYNFILTDNYLVNICRREGSMSSDIKKELVTTISSLSNVLFKIENYSKLNFFLFGILIKFIISFIKINKVFIFKSIKTILATFLIIFFITFYTPLFWNLGKPLLYYDEDKDITNIKNIVVFSGHGDTSYYNMTYQYRYKDIVNISKKIESIQKIYILGRLQDIPEQKIIEKLLISDGFPQEKLEIIYDEFNNTDKNIKQVLKILKQNNVDQIVFITSPYHTKRSKLLWDKHTDIDVKIFKSYNWPTKNKYFQYAKNKKIILYEHLSILYNKSLGNL